MILYFIGNHQRSVDGW